MDEKDKRPKPDASVLRFPFSRTNPPRSGDKFKELGTGAMARHLNMRDSKLTGHWCSRCQGIWFGYGLEVECPQCGNRRG